MQTVLVIRNHQQILMLGTRPLEREKGIRERVGVVFLCRSWGRWHRLPLVAQMVKNLPAMQEPWVRSLGGEDPLEKGMATCSSILAWRIPWTEESGGLQSMGLQRVGHDCVTKHRTICSQNICNMILIFNLVTV